MTTSTHLLVIARYVLADADDRSLVEDLLVQLAAASRREPGNIDYTVGTVLDEPGSFVIVERYRDQASFDAHRASSHFADFVQAQIVPLLSERTVTLHELS